MRVCSTCVGYVGVHMALLGLLWAREGVQEHAARKYRISRPIKGHIKAQHMCTFRGLLGHRSEPNKTDNANQTSTHSAFTGLTVSSAQKSRIKALLLYDLISEIL